MANDIFAIFLNLVLASVVLHGVSVTPLMNTYERTMERRREKQRKGQEPKPLAVE